MDKGCALGLRGRKETNEPTNQGEDKVGVTRCADETLLG